MTQKLVKNGDLALYSASEKTFGGGLPKVGILFNAPGLANAALVHFPRGVRTAWHTHPAG